MRLLKYANMKFAHHHLHTEYSPQDAPVELKKLVKYSKELGYKTLTVTDHGTVSSWVKLQQYCKDAGIKPIFGIEAYFCNDRHLKSGGRVNHHLVLLAKNNEGIKNIFRMSELSYREGFYYSPRIDWDLLEKYHEGVICTSACVSGIVPETYAEKGIEAALPIAQRFKDIFGRDFYAEVQYHCLDIEHKAYAGVARIAKTLDIPLLGTNDVHYLRKEDSSTQEAMTAINIGKCLKDPSRMKHEQNQLYLKSPDEMVEVFGGRNREAVVSALELAEVCTAELQFGKTQLPSIEIPKEFDGKAIADDMDYLEALAWAGLKARGKAGDKKYVDRMTEELLVIRSLRQKGLRFDRYFLVVWDYVKWAWDNGIRVGAGRGSGAGSLVLYCLRITGIDPLPLDLLFERFLTPDRNEMPDIDIDFDRERGDEVYDYVCRRFGVDRCARVGTLATFHVASALKAAFKVFDPGNTWEKQVAEKEYAQHQRNIGQRGKAKEPVRDETKRIADDISKLLPEGQSGGPSEKCTLLKEKYDAKPDELIYVYDAVPKFRELKKQYPEVFALAEKIEGLAKGRGVHAAGVLITEDPLVDVVPQQFSGKSQQMATAFAMDDCEKLGCIKFDFLMTKALTSITRTLAMVKARHGVEIDIDNLVPDDKKALDIFKKGETLAVFQFESEGMVKMLKELKPDCFEDVIAANAIYRPGPIENIGTYCKRKHGQEAITYPVDILQTVLKPTYGIMVYQEQVMKITSVLAGFDGSEADKVRKAMGKKKKDILDAMADKFFKGIEKMKTCGLNVAKDLWSQMEKFGSYAFNKSHAAAYAYTAYQCAYLKAHYPAEFMAAQLTVEGADSKYDTVKMYENGADDMGFRILAPEINKVQADYSVEDLSGDKKAIRKGLKGVKGLGDDVYNDILNARKERKFKDMYDYCFRAGNGAKNDIFTTLLDAGAFDEWIKPDGYLTKRLGRKASRKDLEHEYNDMSKRAQNEKREKGARKEEKEGIGFVFAVEPDAAPEQDFRL